MKCANCDKDAMYEYKISLQDSILYCGKDLPSFLDERRRAGLLTITPKLSEEQQKALNTLSLKVEKPEVSEEPKPTKKASKKAANK